MWITIIIIFITVLNVSAVGIFGEAEFVFTSIKLIAIIGLLILSVVIMAGGAPNHEAIGFKYWSNPGGESTSIGRESPNLQKPTSYERIISGYWS